MESPPRERIGCARVAWIDLERVPAKLLCMPHQRPEILARGEVLHNSAWLKVQERAAGAQAGGQVSVLATRHRVALVKSSHLLEELGMHGQVQAWKLLSFA